MQFTKGLRAWWLGAAKETKKVKSLAGGGMLAALGILLKSLSIPLSPLLKISFSFLATALSGFFYGPLVAGFAGMIVDLLGYLIRPDGAYFFGYTFSAFCSGFIYGLWLYRRPVRLWRTAAACLTWALVVSLFLNPLWLSITTGAVFWALIPTRLLTNALLLPINTALLFTLLKVVDKQVGRLRG